MNDSSRKIPSYRRLKRANGRHLAFVDISSQRHYLGAYDSPESHEVYARLIAQWKSCQGAVVRKADLTVVELVNLFRKRAENYYRNPDGSRGAEADNYNAVLAVLRDLYGRSGLVDFTPQSLKAVRQVMIDRGWSRRHINREVVRVRTIFKWGVSEGLVPVEVFAALGTLSGLRAGRTTAKEKPPIRAVTEAEVQMVLPHLPPIAVDMIQVQLLTGMRPGELCQMRPIDIDTTGKVWLYRPATHKNKWRGRERVIPIGPQARTILEPYLHNRPVHVFIFSPAEADAQRREQRHKIRKTPLTCGNRPGTNRREEPQTLPGNRYTTGSFAQAIAYGCKAAHPHPDLSKIKRKDLSPEQRAELRRWRTEHRWAPNQLRHAAATRIRREAGLEMARAVLGHTTMGVTEQFYAEADLTKASELIAKIG